MAGGRPSKYTEELARLICERVAVSTENLKVICARYPDMPTESTIRLWRWNRPEFSRLYAQAKMFQAEFMAEDILDIADDDSKDIKYDEDGNESCNAEFVARSRLRIDTRKWLASKLAPKIYGDRSIVETTIKHEENIQDLK